MQSINRFKGISSMAPLPLSMSMIGFLLFIVPSAHLVMAEELSKTASSSMVVDFLLFVGQSIWNVFFVLGAIIQYYPQWVELRQGKGDAFSPLICFILLTSNLIRVVYWLGEPFDVVLLLQSIVMIIVQFALIQAMTAKETKLVKSKQKPKKTIFDASLSEFWTWTDMHSYNIFAASLLMVLGISFAFLEQYPLYVSFLGYLALLTEAMLGVPQVIKNITDGCANLSPYLFFTWLAGDLAKTFFFIQSDAPLPFLVCGLFQIAVGVLILAQIFYARLTTCGTTAKMD